MLPLTSGTKALRKRLHPAPPLDTIDPDFNVAFDNIRHGPKLEKELNIDHLADPQQGRLRALIKEFWCVFNEKGVMIPVKDYECVIDTGNHAPIACKSVTYGILETPIIQQAISSLLELQ